MESQNESNDLKETCVESYIEPVIKGFSRMLKTMTAAVEDMSAIPCEKACLSVNCRRPCPNERGDPFKMLQMRRLEFCWTIWKSKFSQKNEFQTNYDRRSMQQLSEIVETQEGLRCAQAEEFQRRDQQFIPAKLGITSSSWWKSRWNGRIQESSEFHVRRYCKKKTSRAGHYLELIGKIQELQNEINCMNDSEEFQDAESIRIGNSTLPVHLDYSHFFQFLEEC